MSGQEQKKDLAPSGKELSTGPVYLSDFFGVLVDQEKFADVHFLVGSSRIPAHRLVLAASSPLFETMLYPPPNDEPSADMPTEVVVEDDTSVETFLSLLRCIYTDKVDVNENNLHELVVVARKYNIRKLQLICAAYMQSMVDVEHCCTMFELGPTLLQDPDFALDFIEENAELVIESESFLKLSEPRLLHLLASDKLTVDEVPLFNMVQEWGKAECRRQGKTPTTEALREVLRDVLPTLRIPTMDVAELAACVQPSGLVEQEEMLELFAYAATPLSLRETKAFPYSCTPRQGGFAAKDSRLLERRHKKEIMRLFGLSKDTPKKLSLELLYRGSRDGLSAGAFHVMCDKKQPTITFVRPVNSTNLFGGYFEGAWNISGSYSSATSWIFSLENARGEPLKMLPQSTNNNTYNNASYGPTWGGGHDLHINNNMSSPQSYTNPSTYQKVAPGYTGTFTKELFAGSYKFAVAEIETFLVHLKGQ